MVTIEKDKLVLRNFARHGFQVMVLNCKVTGVCCEHYIRLSQNQPLGISRARYHLMKKQIMRVRESEYRANEVS